MITYQHGFDPAAQYQVSTWRGFQHAGNHYRQDDLVTTSDIPADILFTLLRFGTVRKFATPKSPSAPGTQAAAATGAGGNRITVQPQPRQEAGVTATRPPLDRKWLATASTEELRRECEVRGRDNHGDKNQLRARLLALVG